MYPVKFLLSLFLLLLIPLAPAHAFKFSDSGNSTETIVVASQKLKSPAKLVRVLGCPRGTFLDPRKGGECWTCPKNYKRTVFPVFKNKACQKKGNVLGGYTRAKFVKAQVNKCPKKSFRNGLTKRCYSCPPGFTRSARPGANLEKMPDACIRKR